MKTVKSKQTPLCGPGAKVAGLLALAILGVSQATAAINDLQVAGRKTSGANLLIAVAPSLVARQALAQVPQASWWRINDLFGVARAEALVSLAILVVLHRIKGQPRLALSCHGIHADQLSVNNSDTETSAQSPLFRVLGKGGVLPVPGDLTSLKTWIQAQRVGASNRVLPHDRDRGPESKTALDARPRARPSPPSQAAVGEPRPGFPCADLSRVKFFESLEEPQLEAFSQYLEVVSCPQFGHIIRQGERGEAMYLVLKGEVRALSIVEGHELPLATLGAGQWFGEISVLDRGPREVDVIANKDSVLLKLSSESFERLHREAPTLAIHFLLVLARTLTGRVRQTHKRFEDSIRFIRTSGILD